MLWVVAVPGRCTSDVEQVFSNPHADEPLHCCRFRDETPQSGEDGIPTRESTGTRMVDIGHISLQKLWC